ncbi:S46 family peptidase [Rheinheimera sp. 4Y26]|uniref:S46 family peptidase n=1 Tax=Rheinheimera sp. 4Y26 TaxID=2977811 RepID=UPI0021B11FF3|nr:S46 family peptidase [Rheinheimera sp. 4Y26]MCT6700951.1 S46 family peptidase [Rheinheimera sp. 4Y26]
MMKKTMLAVALLCGAQAVADEGMWQPHQLPELETVLKSKGLAIDAKSIAELTSFPMNAVISLGGCTASFVSNQGLVVTNHHCAYGSIQHNSTAQNNLLANGFLAKSLDEELPAAPGSKVFVTEEVRNVTRDINQELTPALMGKDRFDKIDELRKGLVADCEATPGYRCDVYSFHGGLEYYLIKQLEIRDVRLVHAPAGGVGKFGGDIDNWMWPRHTGDYSFYRAYVGKDGKPADFNADNVPFTPPSFLKVSAKGVQENDFVMVIGYPGRTSRYNTAFEVKNQFTEVLPQSKAYREETIALIKQLTAEGSESRIKYEAILAGLANYAKNFDGMLQSYQKGSTQQRKDEFEAVLNRWIKSDTSRKARFAPAVKNLQQLIEEGAANQQRDLVMNYFGYAQMFSTARKLYRNANEQLKPDAERESGYQQRDAQRFEAGLKRMSRSFDPAVDLEIALHFLEHYSKLPAKQRLAAFDKFFGLDSTAFDKKLMREKLQAMYSASTLADEVERLAWVGKSVEDFQKSEDPLIKFAIAMYETDLAEENKTKEWLGKMAVARPKVMEAVIAFNKTQNKPVYADANSTLRVTYGTVQGYQPRDAVSYSPFTTLKGISEKFTGVDPFDAPAKQMAAIAKGDFAGYLHPQLNAVPVNFLSNVDTTGGNSGSPTLNGNAELVGLLFDGVIEGIIGNFDYDPALNRSIHVDSRYMLWQMEKVDGASNLIKEMDIVR